jgi:hypothetical protein
MTGVRMEPDLATDPRLLGILAELKQREPIFHRREIISSREFVWSALSERYATVGSDAYETEGWAMADEQVRGSRRTPTC